MKKAGKITRLVCESCSQIWHSHKCARLFFTQMLKFQLLCATSMPGMQAPLGGRTPPSRADEVRVCGGDVSALLVVSCSSTAHAKFRTPFCRMTAEVGGGNCMWVESEIGKARKKIGDRAMIARKVVWG